jgi:hypothetical protein
MKRSEKLYAPIFWQWQRNVAVENKNHQGGLTRPDMRIVAGVVQLPTVLETSGFSAFGNEWETQT